MLALHLDDGQKKGVDEYQVVITMVMVFRYPKFQPTYKKGGVREGTNRASHSNLIGFF